MLSNTMPREVQDKAEKARRVRVGQLIRRRRLELGLSQGDLSKILGHRTAANVSTMELGNEGVPLKHVYRLADVLRLPSDSFYRFVLGEIKNITDDGHERAPAKGQHSYTVSDGERDLLEDYRRLSEKYQGRVRENIHDYLIVDGKDARARGRVRKLRP